MKASEKLINALQDAAKAKIKQTYEEQKLIKHNGEEYEIKKIVRVDGTTLQSISDDNIGLFVATIVINVKEGDGIAEISHRDSVSYQIRMPELIDEHCK